MASHCTRMTLKQAYKSLFSHTDTFLNSSINLNNSPVLIGCIYFISKETFNPWNSISHDCYWRRMTMKVTLASEDHEDKVTILIITINLKTSKMQWINDQTYHGRQKEKQKPQSQNQIFWKLTEKLFTAFQHHCHGFFKKKKNSQQNVQRKKNRMYAELSSKNAIDLGNNEALRQKSIPPPERVCVRRKQALFHLQLLWHSPYFVLRVCFIECYRQKSAPQKECQVCEGLLKGLSSVTEKLERC